MIAHCLTQLFHHVIKPAAQRKFDKVVQEWALDPRQHYIKSYASDFPRLLFKDGVSSITNISAGTKVGILFAIVVAALTSEGQDVLLNDAKLTTSQYFNMIEAFELLLSYWVWLKKEEFWDIFDTESMQNAKLAIFKMINCLKHLFPRSSGNEWKIPKIHEQMHVAYYIWLYGSHLNIHTGPQEHNHIANSKKPSQRTQKRKKLFDWQLGNCLNDQYSIGYVTNKIKHYQSEYNNDHGHKEKIDEISNSGSNMASKFEVSMKLQMETNKINVEYQWITASMKTYKISCSILELITKHFFQTQPIPEQIKGIHVYGVTEYTVNDQTYRAHPCYKNDLPWFDWVLIAWNIPNSSNLSSRKVDDSPDYVVLPLSTESNSNEINTAMLIPAKLICIITDECNNAFAIVHSCLQHQKKVSVLTYRWQMEYENVKVIRDSNAQYQETINSSELTPVYHTVTIDSIQKHCLIVPYKNESQFVMEVIDQNIWASCFSNV